MPFPSFAHAAAGLSAPAIAGLLFALPAQASDALAVKHGCLGCHAKASALVGPSYQAIAERYAGQADAAAMLAKKIRAGGGGVWGELVMPAQTGVTEADAKKLASWVLKTAK